MDTTKGKNMKFKNEEQYEEDLYGEEYGCKVVTKIPARVYDQLEGLAYEKNITIGETVTEILKWWEDKHA